MDIDGSDDEVRFLCGLRRCSPLTLEDSVYSLYVILKGWEKDEDGSERVGKNGEQQNGE